MRESAKCECRNVWLKIRCFIWRALLNKLLVAANLEARGIQVQIDTCLLCNEEKETCDHILINCIFAIEAQQWILKWCEIPTTKFNGVADLLNFVANWGSCPCKKEMINATFYGLLWFIWVARNNKVFKQIGMCPTKVVDEVISQRRILGSKIELKMWKLGGLSGAYLLLSKFMYFNFILYCSWSSFLLAIYTLLYIKYLFPKKEMFDL